ncbi:MAG: Protein of unknown function transrane [Firmicutes bacterium]|nr:Protein of unknown function transrane [Bacillota bacterium]
MVRSAKNSRYNAKPQRPAGIMVLIFKGVVVGFIVSIIAAVLFALATITTDNDLLEEYNRYIVVAITVISIFLGSAYAAKKAGCQGVIIGISVGVIYVLISVAIGLELDHDSPLLLVMINRLMAGVAAGALGGLVGVNL